MKRLPALLLLFVTQANAAPLVWVTDAMQRIQPQAPAGSGQAITVYAAKGDYESFQIVVRGSGGDVTNVDVAVSDFVGAGTIPASNVTLFREHFVEIPINTERWSDGDIDPLPTGWYPDALIPFVDPVTGEDIAGARFDAVPFDVDNNSNQPVWVDVFVPRDAEAGTYTATASVTSDQGNATVEIALNVWDFELPVTSTMRTHFSQWDDHGEGAIITMLKNRLMSRRPDRSSERHLIDTYGLSSIQLPFWSGANVDDCTMSDAPTVSRFEEQVAGHQPELLMYVYSADEISSCQGLYPTIGQWGDNIHQAGIKHLIVMIPDEELFDVVDIWVVQPRHFVENESAVRAAQAAGNEVWIYQTLYQDEYSPKWELDYRPIEFRIYGFICQSVGLTGMLYWSVDRFTDDSWTDIYGWGGRPYPGNGLFVYPGADAGVNGICPSMRVKWLREAVEDYEFVAILKELGEEDFALQTISDVAGAWDTWTMNTDDFYAARKTLGDKIHELSAPTSIQETSRPATIHRGGDYAVYDLRGALIGNRSIHWRRGGVRIVSDHHGTVRQLSVGKKPSQENR